MFCIPFSCLALELLLRWYHEDTLQSLNGLLTVFFAKTEALDQS